MSAMPEARQRLDAKLRVGARALARGGLVNAYGHCSVRIDETTFLVCAPQPMSTIGTDVPGTVVPVEGPLPESVLGEVRVHQQIYKRRTDVNAVCRVIPPQVLALSVLGLTPRARHAFSAYFYPAPPLWDSAGFLRSDERAAEVADLLGQGPAVVMRGNGAVTAAETLEQAVTLAWFLEDSARVELTVLGAGMAETAPLLSEAEALERSTWQGRVADRMWIYLTSGDPEAAAMIET